MLKIFLFCLLFTQLFQAQERLYITASGDQQVEVYDLDSENGSLKKVQSIATSYRPGNSVFSHDGKYLYVAVRDKNMNGLDTFKVKENGLLEKVHFANTPEGCGFITLDQSGEFLLSSHYGPGKASVYQLKSGVYQGDVIGVYDTDQKSHCIRVHRSNQYAYVPHTGPNKIYQFSFSKQGLKPLANAYVEGPDTENAYHEPRHCVFHPTLEILYSSNERGGGLSSWKVKPNGELELWQTKSTLPDNFDWQSAASDVQITPNGKFVYVANRYGRKNTNPEPKDSIASFRLDPSTGKILKRSSIVPTGQHPRSIRINHNGKFLFATGVKSANVKSYKINPEDGSLTLLHTSQTGLSPMWISSLNQP